MSVAPINIVDETVEVSTSTPPSFVGSLSGSNDLVTVSSTGTTTISGITNFIQWFQPISAQAGSGAYTHKFILDRTTAVPKKGATFQVTLSIVASNNPTIEIYDGSISGTLLQRVLGDSSNVTEFAFEAEYDLTNWVKTEGEYIL